MSQSVLVVSAHPGDFVWRCAGAIAKAVRAGDRVLIACLSYGERGESASLWRAGHDLDAIKRVRREEAERAAGLLGADVRFLDAGDYPLMESPQLLDQLVGIYREVLPTVILTHSADDPYNGDHAAAAAIALRARVLAQAPGVRPEDGAVLGAPPVYRFEPHQPEMCGFVPDLLLDITDVWDTKVQAMQSLGAQGHLFEYYTDLGRRRGTQAKRNSGPNLGLPSETYAEAYQRVFPTVTDELS